MGKKNSKPNNKSINLFILNIKKKKKKKIHLDLAWSSLKNNN